MSGTSYQDSAYEAEVAPHKRALFARLGAFPPSCTVVEIGVGGFGNAALYPPGTLVTGVEPDLRKHASALAHARTHNVRLQILAGVAEALPMPDCSVDAVVMTCTLCSVACPHTALREVLRVLKPGGMLLFWEHILSESDAGVARLQRAATPRELLGWGCRFDRRSLEAVESAGFGRLHGIAADGACYLELPGLGLMGPTAAGIGVK